MQNLVILFNANCLAFYIAHLLYWEVQRIIHIQTAWNCSIIAIMAASQLLYFYYFIVTAEEVLQSYSLFIPVASFAQSV